MSRVEIAVLLVALAVSVLAFTALAGRLDFPAPLLLIAVGVAASYLPCVPEIDLEPEIVLLGLLPPLLYAAAIRTSLVDFNANRRAIPLLSVGLVLFTTFGVGAIVHPLIPGLSWPVSFAIGAVVAPPDAVAATAVARRIGLPRRIVTILEGESLLNDATALVALRTAIAATAVGVEAFARRRGLPDRLGRRGGHRLRGLRRSSPAAQADHRPGPGHRALVPGPVRRLHRRRGDPCLGRHRRRRRRPAPRAQGAGRADRAVAHRRAHQLAHHRVRPREHRLPADRPAGRLDPRGRHREHPLGRAHRAVCVAVLVAAS